MMNEHLFVLEKRKVPFFFIIIIHQMTLASLFLVSYVDSSLLSSLRYMCTRRCQRNFTALLMTELIERIKE